MRAAVLALALLLVPFLAPLVPASGGASVQEYAVVVGDRVATGVLALPADLNGTKGLVVILHGYGHSGHEHAGHALHVAEEGWISVAMDYSGDINGFPLLAGAQDTRAAIRDIEANYAGALAGKPTILYSVSMGTAVAAELIPMMPGTFSYWVDNEGLSQLTETWAEATAVAPQIPFGAVAKAGIEAETGGTPATVPQAYVERSAVERAPEFVGLQGVVLSHGVNDGLVPYDQGREMQTALHAIGVPTEFYTVLRTAPGTEGTTITGDVGQGGQGFAGHGTESDDTHALTKLSFALLDQVLDGSLRPSNGEHVIDSQLGAIP